MYSLKIVFNKQRVSKDGTAALYARVVVDRDKYDVPLKVRWLVDRFDHENGLCTKRHRGDQEAEDNNMLIRSVVARANEIFKYYRINDIPLTISRFKRDFKNDISKKDFLKYMARRIKMRLAAHEIKPPTAINHEKAWRKLREWKSEVLFSDFDENWCADFDAWLKKHCKARAGNGRNNRWSIHKCIKTYMRLAERDSIRFVYPYKFFSISPTRGNWKAIFEKDIALLYNYYHDVGITIAQKRILRAFLFTCMTGLRISDLRRVTQAWDHDGVLVFVEFKKMAKNKPLEVPLNRMAREMFADALADTPPGGFLFRDYGPQYCNRELKKMAKKLGIDTNMHWHVGRHSFITLVGDRLDVQTAQEWAGHESMRQTEIYMHFNRSEGKAKMAKLDDIV